METAGDLPSSFFFFAFRDFTKCEISELALAVSESIVGICISTPAFPSGASPRSQRSRKKFLPEHFWMREDGRERSGVRESEPCIYRDTSYRLNSLPRIRVYALLVYHPLPLRSGNPRVQDGARPLRR
jgi:hypothetical protein